MDCIVQGVAKSLTQLSHFHFKLCLDEKRPIAKQSLAVWVQGGLALKALSL